MKKIFVLLFILPLLLNAMDKRKYIYDGNIKGKLIPVIGRENCKIYYPFSPVPPNLTVKYDEKCKNGLAVGVGKIIFYSNGEKESSATVDFSYRNGAGKPLGAGYGTYTWNFVDGEIWEGHNSDWIKIKNSDKKQLQLKAEEKRRQEIENRRNINFRKNVQVGDETTRGLVIQVKGKLVKIQTTNTQCSQRNYDGNCINYINTPVEKWYKRNEIYPK